MILVARLWYNLCMNIYSLSDLHLSFNCLKPMNIFGSVWDNYLDEVKSECDKLGDEDILLIAGDISWAMTLDEAKPDLDFIGSIKGKKVLIRGNHDYWWKSISAVRGILPSGVYAIQNDCLRIGNILITGSRGWGTPEVGCTLTKEDRKIYDREIVRFGIGLEAASKQRADGDKLIVMSHYPPFNSTMSPTPFTELFCRYNVDAVVYGHLHGAGVKLCKKVTVGGIPYFLTSCDLVRNKPVLIV